MHGKKRVPIRIVVRPPTPTATEHGEQSNVNPIEYDVDDARQKESDSSDDSLSRFSPPKKIMRATNSRSSVSALMPSPVSALAQSRATKRRHPRRRPILQTMISPLLSEEDETSLFYILKNKTASLNTIADDWIENYQTDKQAALQQLMQFFINASGSKGKITSEMIQTDFDIVTRKMAEDFYEESGKYPLIMHGQIWKKFCANFCDFIQKLVKLWRDSLIHDSFLTCNIISLLTSLSNSRFRAFRHTATLAVMKFMTALVDIVLLDCEDYDDCLHQCEFEKIKAGEQTSDHMEVLIAQSEKLDKRITEILYMHSHMFRSIFAHRFKDVMPDIRALCMVEIGIWMEKLPVNFIHDVYLRYVGWTIYDETADVRLKCLQTLQPIFRYEEFKDKIETFTRTYKDRFVCMTLDESDIVAVQAVKLVTSIAKIQYDILTDEDYERVYDIVFSYRRAVALAAGEFLKERLFTIEEYIPCVTKRGKYRLPNTPLIRNLVTFFIESEFHEFGQFLVDSLIESNPVMKDWECMTDLLLEEPGDGEESLDNQQETTLIELMVFCVRQAATGELPIGRDLQDDKTYHTLEEQNMLTEDKQELTVHFVHTLPALLQKYRADADKLGNLIAIPQYFDLNVIIKSCQKSNLSALMSTIKDIILDIHTETRVLEACCKTLKMLCTEGTVFYTDFIAVHSFIIDMCVNKYKEAADEWNSLTTEDETLEEDQIINFKNSLIKVSVLSICYNLNNANIWESIFVNLPQCLEESYFPTEALMFSMKFCYYSLLWGLIDIEEKSCANENDIELLRVRLHSYMNECKAVIAQGYDNSLKKMAYLLVGDLLIGFSAKLYSVHNKNKPVMKHLVYEPDPEICETLNAFVQAFVFVELNDDDQDEKRRLKKLDKRRCCLAAYCKLIIYNVLPIKRAANIFKHYVKYYKDYGEVIKITLNKAHIISIMDCAMTMILSLKILFNEAIIVENDGKISKNMQEFSVLTELAKKFALSFKSNALKNREPIIALHHAGINFAAEGWSKAKNRSATPRGDLPPKNLLFLEIISIFSNKLLIRDKCAVLQILDQKIPGMPSSSSNAWQPLLLYRKSLGRREAKNVPQTRQSVARKHCNALNTSLNLSSQQDGEENAD